MTEELVAASTITTTTTTAETAPISDPLLGLGRFLYLGHFKPFYQQKHNSPIDVEEKYDIIEKFFKTFQLDATKFIEIIENAINLKKLPRIHELWFVYAAFINYTGCDSKKDIAKELEFKKQLKNAFPRLAKSADDLFCFVRYSKSIQVHLKHNGLSKMTRKTVTLWYKSQEPGTIVDMWTKNRGLHGYTHRKLIAMCHINPKILGEEGALILKSDNCTKFLKNKSQENLKSPYYKKLTDICKYKTTGDYQLAKQLIREKKLSYENVPAHFLRKLDIWELLIPVMSYRQLLKSAHYLIDKKLLDNIQLSKTYLRAIGNKYAMITENIHPITFLFNKEQLLKQIRYSEAVKQDYYEKKIRSQDVKKNTFLNTKISKIFDHSFDNYRGNSIKTFVAINLQSNTKRQRLITQKQVSCFDAAVALALSYFKSEKSSIAFTFAENKKLKQIDWKKNWNFTKASEYSQGIMMPKTSQRLIYPIEEAMTRNEVFDLFLIIVPSGTRGNPKNRSNHLIEKLKEYRETKKNDSKLVLVNLHRHNPAMFHDDHSFDGLLEICGLDENTPKLIDAFVSNNFK